MTELTIKSDANQADNKVNVEHNNPQALGSTSRKPNSQTSSQPNSQKPSSNKLCVIVGHSIDALTTATVLASLGNTVQMYAEIAHLQTTLATYRFEHQLHALWTLYNSELGDNRIVVKAIPNDAATLFASGSNELEQPTLYWLFCPELPKTWQQRIDTSMVQDSPTVQQGSSVIEQNSSDIEQDSSVVEQDSLAVEQDSLAVEQDSPAVENKTAVRHMPWISALNDSYVDRQVPIILSGISTLGTFDAIAKVCRRPWVYYVPFVFLQDGQAYTSMLSPKLWLMGEKTAVSVSKVAAIQPLITQAKQCFITDIATTEFARSAIMSMLATRVSFMNEWSRLADVMDVDITEVSKMMGLDTRIGESYLQAGWGFGGQSLPAELTALEQTIASEQLEQPLMSAVGAINTDQKELIFRKFWQYFDGQIEGRTVSIWGASYKPQSGRTTGAAIHTLLHLLWSYDITTEVYAMEASEELARLYPSQPLLTLTDNAVEGLPESEALFILAWPNQADIPLTAINTEATPIFDAQNRFSRSQIENLVGPYVGIGRGK